MRYLIVVVFSIFLVVNELGAETNKTPKATVVKKEVVKKKTSKVIVNKTSGKKPVKKNKTVTKKVVKKPASKSVKTKATKNTTIKKSEPPVPPPSISVKQCLSVDQGLKNWIEVSNQNSSPLCHGLSSFQKTANKKQVATMVATRVGNCDLEFLLRNDLNRFKPAETVQFSLLRQNPKQCAGVFPDRFIDTVYSEANCLNSASCDLGSISQWTEAYLKQATSFDQRTAIRIFSDLQTVSSSTEIYFMQYRIPESNLKKSPFNCVSYFEVLTDAKGCFLTVSSVVKH